MIPAMALSELLSADESPLVESELGDAERLVAAAGWNQTADDWRIFLQYGNVYALRSREGGVIATAATLPYGGRFAWISMVLVAKEFQRRGLATHLLQRCTNDIVAAKLVPVLDATPAGREVYRQMGYRDSWGFQRYAAEVLQVPPAHRSDGVTVANISDAMWPKLCAMDAAAFGADRTGLLTNLGARLPQAALYAERNSRISGFLLGRDGRVATQLGPLIADDDETARALLSHAIRTSRGKTFIDVADTKTDLIDVLKTAGFTSQRPLTRMLHRRTEAFDDGQHTYAVVGPEFG
jgi:GNAT superfamily N-acetyltransferase